MIGSVIAAIANELGKYPDIDSQKKVLESFLEVLGEVYEVSTMLIMIDKMKSLNDFLKFSEILNYKAEILKQFDF
jgi:hypothetical protein